MLEHAKHLSDQFFHNFSNWQYYQLTFTQSDISIIDYELKQAQSINELLEQMKNNLSYTHELDYVYATIGKEPANRNSEQFLYYTSIAPIDFLSEIKCAILNSIMPEIYAKHGKGYNDQVSFSSFIKQTTVDLKPTKTDSDEMQSTSKELEPEIIFNSHNIFNLLSQFKHNIIDLYLNSYLSLEDGKELICYIAGEQSKFLQNSPIYNLSNIIIREMKISHQNNIKIELNSQIVNQPQI